MTLEKQVAFARRRFTQLKLPGVNRQVILKANYFKAGEHSARQFRTSLRYYQTRENDHGETAARQVFSAEHDALTPAQLGGRVKEAEQFAYHYRIILSPATDKEADGIDLRPWTREVMDFLQLQTGAEMSWLAVAHSAEAAHTNTAHTHVLLSSSQRLSKVALVLTRELADHAWQEQKAFYLQADLSDEAVFAKTKQVDNDADQEVVRHKSLAKGLGL